MSPSNQQLIWLRRSLATFVGLLTVTLVCGLLWGLLASLGDAVGARAFRGATLVFAILDGVSGIGLLIGTAWSVTRWMERTESH